MSQNLSLATPAFLGIMIGHLGALVSYDWLLVSQRDTAVRGALRNKGVSGGGLKGEE